MKCFHHNDADGKCSGFWVKELAEQTDSIYGYDMQFIEINHGMYFPLESIRPNEQIYIVDYSIAPDLMRKVLEITKDVTWIDHHKTAIDKYDDFEHTLRGIRYNGIAACELTYCYLSQMTYKGMGDIKEFDASMVKKAPLFTRLIGDFDVWKFEFGDDTRYFSTAFYAYDFQPESENWKNFMQPAWKEFFKPNAHVKKLIKEGVLMTKYRDSWAKHYLEIGFETRFEGLRCFALNLGMCSSEYFKSLPDGEYDVYMPFSFNGEYFKISMYSQTVDVSKVALKYGGGGHMGAAGFECKTLPFDKHRSLAEGIHNG